MSITNKAWFARDDRMPGLNTLTVKGIVTLPDSTTEATLVRSNKVAAGSVLNLDLTLVNNGIGLSVMTDKEASYTQPSGADVTNVNIYFNDVLLTTIDHVEITQ